MAENLKGDVVLIEASAGTGKTSHLTRYYMELVLNQIKSGLEPVKAFSSIVAITFTEKAASEMKERIMNEVKKLNINRAEIENSLLQARISTIHSFALNIIKHYIYEKNIFIDIKVLDRPNEDIVLQETIKKYLIEKKEPALKHYLRKLKALINKHPFVYMWVDGGDLKIMVQEIEKRFLDEKLSKASIGYNDIEKIAHEILKNPSAVGVLIDYNLKFNHLLVDEFQDVSLLQYEILNEVFIDEWLQGSKNQTTIFFVGDKKQSIYYFRGAESTLIDEFRSIVKERSVKLKTPILNENKRSTMAICNFVNSLFGKYMKNYIPINSPDQTSSEISIIKFPTPEKWIAGKIIELVNKDKKFSDIAILIRTRRHLKEIENVLNEYGINFIVIGGIGFYQTPELHPLELLIFAVAYEEPVSMYILKSEYGMEPDINTLRSMVVNEGVASTIEKVFREYIEKLSSYEAANVEKFLKIVSENEVEGLYRLAYKLTKWLEYEDEEKADIFSPVENAVRILTVHKAKGLEFDTVFVYDINEFKPSMRNETVKIMRKDRGYSLSFDEEEIKKQHEQKLYEEAINLLYVAFTRAKRNLYITIRDT